MLQTFGFQEEWVQWVINLSSSAFFSILVNGTPSQPFRSSRGIRQGDPFSLFLFVLMAKGLGRTLKAMKDGGELKGLSLNQGVPTQNHQQFLDYTMLMGHSVV